MFRPQTRRIVGRIFEALNSLKAKFRRINNYRQSQGRLFNVRSFVMANIFLAFTFAKIHMEDNRDERIKGLKTLIKTQVCSSTDIPEGKIYYFERNIDGRIEPIVIARYKGKLYAVGGLCTYDLQTPLKDTIIFNDKLYCPKHGCAFDIESGTVELSPAIDNLPRFRVQQSGGRVYVHAPIYMPKKMMPPCEPRDHTDLRKVVIVGNGSAAFGCIEGLRQNGYTGEITMITTDFEYPYDRTKLYRSIKNIDYNNLYFRNQEWYEMFGVTLLFGREVTEICHKHVFPYIILEDGTRVEFDGLLVATGSGYSLPKHKSLTKSKKSFFLRNIKDHKKLREKLETVKSVSVVGVNPKSIGFCSTLRRQYPNLQINLIDENVVNKLEDTLGQPISDKILDELYLNNVSSYCGIKLNQIQDNKDSLVFRLEDNLEVKSDIAVLFPSNNVANTHLINNSHMDADLDFNQRIKVDSRCRTQVKRVFAAGNCTAIEFFATMKRMPCENSTVAYHQGYTVAYNMLALNIPFHQVPFWSVQVIDKRLDYVGYTDYFNEVIIVGDVEKWDFVAFYSEFGKIVAIAATPSQKNAIQIYAEAFRLSLMPDIKQIQNGKCNTNTMQRLIRKANKSGCYKDPIHEIKDKYILSEVIWTHRDNDRYVKDPKDMEGYLPGRVDEKGYFQSYK